MPPSLRLFDDPDEAPGMALGDYDLDHCWQYDIRLRNAERDLVNAGINQQYANSLRVTDFTFREVTDKDDRKDLALFIKRHEWLGTLSQYTTHWYGAYHGNLLAGVLLLNMPNAFSKLLGDDTPELERLISRGACVSWSPKNLASAFVMFAIRDMAKRTRYRLFTAYSDPMARELGTIYQACNFYYLGQSAGATARYVNPYTGRIVSDRFFRARSAYKRYAKDLGIRWRYEWSHGCGMLWDNIPDEVEVALREHSKKMQAGAEKISVPAKHKYAMVQGCNKKETAALRRTFEQMNKTYPYPKVRS